MNERREVPSSVVGYGSLPSKTVVAGIEYETVEWIENWLVQREDGSIEFGRGQSVPYVGPFDRIWWTAKVTDEPTTIRFRDEESV